MLCKKYERNSLILLDNIAGDQPGLRTVTTFAQSTFLNLSGVRLPLTPFGAPLSTIPLNELTQVVRSYDDNLRVPYVQNWNVSLQRELFKGGLFEVRYVGNKGTKLIRGINISESNIFRPAFSRRSVPSRRAAPTRCLRACSTA